MLGCRISSDLIDLDQLHSQYPWIPNSESIRPSPEILETKKKKLEEIERSYVEFVDYFYSHVYGKALCVRETDGKLFVTDRNIRGIRVFLPNMFPYQLGGGGRHWVMWYGDLDMMHVDHTVITDDIRNSIHQHVGSYDFDFAWYVNPKMTVPEFFHVQMFWCTLQISEKRSEIS